jgi:membrane-bound lytic murein transglycosylase B
MVALSVPFGVEYRVGFTNFNAITRYNRSHMYASAVNDLAVAVAAERARDAAQAAATQNAAQVQTSDADAAPVAATP